jgi:DNA-binding transcriptional ArsR family regulator
VTQLIQEISQLDRVIHEPARLTIMLILGGVGEADFLYLQREGGFTQGNLSGHLAKLEDAGYVEIEKKFKGKVPLTVCSLTGAGKAAFSTYSQRMLGVLQSNGASNNLYLSNSNDCNSKI